MAMLPTAEFQAIVPKLREKGFYVSQEMRNIFWHEYNLSQVEEAKETLTFISTAVDECKPVNLKGRVGKPLTNPKILSKAVLFCEALHFVERKAQGWLSLLGPFVSIYQQLDDRVIGEAYNRPEIVYILKQVFDKTKTSDGILGGDGTGMETSRKQNYESIKESGGYMTSIVDSREVVQSFDINGKQECRAMHQLVKEVEGNSLRLDAGFVDRKLVELLNRLGIKPYVFPKKSIILNAKGNYGWTKMYLELLEDVQKWLEEYHQRSHCESFHSSFKRSFGIVTKRNPTAQLTQITARIILHNRKRQSYFNKLANAN